MSDRTNRDKGRKATHKKKWMCGCWHCTDGKSKLRLLTERSAGKHPDREMTRELS